MYACDDLTYYSINYVSLLVLITSACFIDDLSLIFGIIAGCSESMMDYVFPGLFFICSMKYVNKKNWKLKALVVLFILIGISIFLVSNYLNVRKLI